MNYDKLIAEAKRMGFTHAAPLKVSTIELREDVREMCAANACNMYGTNWSCPPACGTLEACRERIYSYESGLLVQTVYPLEDELDGYGMLAARDRHNASFTALHAHLLETYPRLLAIGTGCCMRCAKCSYPDAPCRFPEQMTSSMEAFGMLVLQVCRDNGMEYYYGPNQIAYTGCFLLA